MYKYKERGGNEKSCQEEEEESYLIIVKRYRVVHAHRKHVF